MDCETSGPVPGLYNLLQVGACLVDDPSQTYAVDLKPICDGAVPEAMTVHGLSLERLRRDGTHAEVAMLRFARWIDEVCRPYEDAKPLFVGLGAAFDFAFVSYYFYRFYHRCPFGFAPLDIKAFYAGRFRVPWEGATSSQMNVRLGIETEPDHDALGDALYQAELYRAIRDA